MLDALTTFIIAVATGIAVLAFARPDNWAGLHRKLLLSVGTAAAFCLLTAGVFEAVGAAGFAQKVGRGMFYWGVGGLLICGWASYMRWLTDTD